MGRYKAIDIHGHETPVMEADGLQYLRQIGQLTDDSLVLSLETEETTRTCEGIIQSIESGKWMPFHSMVGVPSGSAPLALVKSPQPVTPVAPSNQPQLSPLSSATQDPWEPSVNRVTQQASKDPPAQIPAPFQEATNQVPSSGLPAGYGYAQEPWSRLWAYWLDSNLIVVAGSWIFGILLGAVGIFSGKDDAELKALDWVLGFVLLWTLVPLLISASQSMFGTTPGKAFFGIKVLQPDGSTPSFSMALNRNYVLLVNGLYGGIPIVLLFGANNFLKNLRKGQKPSWDLSRTAAYQLQPEKKRIGSMWVVAIFGFIVLMISRVISEVITKASS